MNKIVHGRDSVITLEGFGEIRSGSDEIRIGSDPGSPEGDRQAIRLPPHFGPPPSRVRWNGDDLRKTGRHSGMNRAARRAAQRSSS